jgi:hypothetical protein
MNAQTEIRKRPLIRPVATIPLPSVLTSGKGKSSHMGEAEEDGSKPKARHAIADASLVPRSLTPVFEAPTSVYLAGVGVGIGCGSLVLLLLLGALGV